MSSSHGGPNVWNSCTFETCTIQESIFQYRPSLAANSVFVALFGIGLIIHALQGVIMRDWTFGVLMSLGCICEVIGYAGRIVMWNDPWGFDGFIIEIVCITIAPVFMTAAVYITLYRSVIRLSLTSAAFRPSLYYQVFIPCDVVALVLQAVGGAMSTQSNGSSKVGVDIGLVGLSFQVLTLIIFIALAAQYGLLYQRDLKSGIASRGNLDGRIKTMSALVSLATVLILIRCVYRIYELSDGYRGPALHNQGEFIALESCVIVTAVFLLSAGHPGFLRKRAVSPDLAETHLDRKDNSSGECPSS